MVDMDALGAAGRVTWGSRVRMIPCFVFFRGLSANTAPVNRVSHGVVRMEDNGLAKTRTGAMILGSFLTRPRILRDQPRDTRRIDSVEVLPASSSLGSGSNQRLSNRRVSQCSRVRHAKLSNVCGNLVANGSLRRVLMIASKGSFAPINPMPNRPEIAFPNYNSSELVPVLLPVSRYPREVQSEIFR